MANKEPMTYKNHRMIVPGYHYALCGIFFVNFLFRAWKLVTDFSLDRGMAFLVAFGLLLVAWYVRIFPLKVHDRVIRLEMRLRLHEVLPEDLRGRIDELKKGQLIGLRFASDEELPDLVREALDQGLGGEAVKKKIKNWQNDPWRM